MSKPIRFCNCALPSMIGSTKCCEHCLNHKRWETQDDYTYDRYKLEQLIEENEEKETL